MGPLAPSPRRRTALVLALVVAMAAARPLGGAELGREAMPRQPTGRRIPARFCGCSLRLAGGGEPKTGKRRQGVGRDPAGSGGTRETGQSKTRHAPDAGQVDSITPPSPLANCTPPPLPKPLFVLERLSLSLSPSLLLAPPWRQPRGKF